jgi:uncharacterized lipoprotein YddW (UPF0748 family)
MEKTMSKKRIVSCIMLFSIVLILLIGTSRFNDLSAQEKEMKAVWISTAWALDYPDAATTDEEKLKSDAVKMLDNIMDMGFNTIFFQVRPSSDAFYDSDVFPWSRFLTGTQGKAPENNFDPLKFIIEESHKRNIEVHAWVNPYRVTASAADNNNLSPYNPAVLHPELTVLYTDGKLYYNPGEPGVHNLIIDGVKEILDKYDVDGIHLDDYFYPAKDFDDEETYAMYGGQYSSKDQWRRDNINKLIKELDEVVHNKDPKIAFGVSPFGIWANKNSNPLGSDTSGWETYISQYADSRMWVKEEYVDYIIPQLYFYRGYKIADYETLINWWSNVVEGTNVKLYIGQAAYLAVGAKSDSLWYGGKELREQLNLNKTIKNINGYCMFRYKSFIDNNDLYSAMKTINNTNNETETNKIEEENLHFTDIYDHPLKEYIEYMAEKGIVLGYNGKYKPDKNIKRADFVLMLMRALKMENTSGIGNFDDVPKDAYYYDELSYAKEAGLIYGSGSNLFSPEEEITRQDMIVMTYRALNMLNIINDQTGEDVANKYIDCDEISDYAFQPIAYFTENADLSGYKGKIRPLNLSNRAETATFLAKLIQSGMFPD